MKTEGSNLPVFIIDETPGPSRWLDQKRAEIIPVPAAEAIERISGIEGPFLLDLTGERPFPLDDVFSRNGTILADPWGRESDPGWFSYHNVSTTRVVAFSPLIYRPALLEIRRFLDAGELGDLAGIEFSASTFFRPVDLLYTVVHLFGPPSGYKTGAWDGARQGFESFLWYSNFACSVKLVSSMAARAVEIKAACRGGMLRAAPDDSFLRVFPAGGEEYGIPLPDGDGIYYNLLDVIDTILSPLNDRAFSARQTVNAIGWVQECVNERPSLLL